MNDTLIKLEISYTVYDAPAQAFILGVKSHNTYFECTSCIEQLSYVKNRVVFPGVDSPLRTDKSFRDKSNEDYHKFDSPFT